jgi:large subunit ribosomal protein L24
MAKNGAAGHGAAKRETGKARGMKIKKGDRVVVIAGRDRGREGTVILADPVRQRVLVQGVSMIKKNTKVNYQGRRGAKEGGIVHQEALIHVSNVALIDPETKKAARAGYRFDGKSKIRVSRPSGKDI